MTAHSSEQLVDRATEVLRQAIVTGHLRPGARLVQEQLANELGVSRTPLREALRRLEQEGLVRVSGNRGLAVTELSPEGLLDNYDVREVLDGLAARLAAVRISPGEQAELQNLHQRSAESIQEWDPEEWMAANAEFHRFILRCAHSPALDRAMPAGRMSGQLLFPGLFLHPEHAADAFEDHALIIDALRARDETGAEVAARRHVVKVREALRAQVERRVSRREALPNLGVVRSSAERD